MNQLRVNWTLSSVTVAPELVQVLAEVDPGRQIGSGAVYPEVGASVLAVS